MAAASMSAVYVATDGSGNYNCDGSKDQIEINDAFQFVANNEDYDTVYLKSGTYVIDDSIKITDNSIFTGDSDTTVRLVEDWHVTRDDMFTPMITGSHFAFQKANDGTNIVIKGFRLYGDGWNQSYIHSMGEWDSFPAIYFHNADRITIQDMTFDDIPGDGIRMYGSSIGMDTRYKVLNCTFNGVGHESIYLQGSEYNLIDGNNIRMIKSPYSEWYDNGIRFDNCANSVITNNTITVDNIGNSGIFLYRGYDLNNVENNTIAYNTIYNTSEMGIYLAVDRDGPTSIATDTYIHHNTLNNCGIEYNTYEDHSGGIWIFGFNNTIIESNVIDGSVGDGIAHRGRDYTDSINKSATYVTTIKYNIITNTVGSPVQDADGYAINNYMADIGYNCEMILENNYVWNNENGKYDTVDSLFGYFQLRFKDIRYMMGLCCSNKN